MNDMCSPIESESGADVTSGARDMTMGDFNADAYCGISDFGTKTTLRRMRTEATTTKEVTVVNDTIS